jgi:hypothetical protein
MHQNKPIIQDRTFRKNSRRIHSKIGTAHASYLKYIRGTKCGERLDTDRAHIVILEYENREIKIRIEVCKGTEGMGWLLGSGFSVCNFTQSAWRSGQVIWPLREAVGR